MECARQAICSRVVVALVCSDERCHLAQRKTICTKGKSSMFFMVVRYIPLLRPPFLAMQVVHLHTVHWVEVANSQSLVAVTMPFPFFPSGSLLHAAAIEHWSEAVCHFLLVGRLSFSLRCICSCAR